MQVNPCPIKINSFHTNKDSHIPKQPPRCLKHRLSAPPHGERPKRETSQLMAFQSKIQKNSRMVSLIIVSQSPIISAKMYKKPNFASCRKLLIPAFHCRGRRNYCWCPKEKIASFRRRRRGDSQCLKKKKKKKR